MFARSRIPVKSILTEGILPSRVQRSVYRRRGYRIATDVELAPGAVIEADDVTIGPGCSIGLGTVIRGKRVTLGRRVSIGSFCFFEGRDFEIGDDTVIREQVFVGGPLLPDSLLSLGKRVRVFQMCFLNPSRPLVIGDDTGVGGRSSLFTHSSWQSALEGYPVTFAPITIGRNVWLPWHVFILPGVELGDDVTIGAGSVVNRSVPARQLAAGVPARVIKDSDAWPRRLEPAEQWALTKSIVTELLDHLAAEGVELARAGGGDGVEATIFWRGRPRRLRLVSAGGTAPADTSGSDVTIFLGPLPADPPATARGAWFDLLAKRKGNAGDEVAREVEDFLARYGMRFAPSDEA
jgi:acetyltransferase-like isoleucine patch superfamily enzyme